MSPSHTKIKRGGNATLEKARKRTFSKVGDSIAQKNYEAVNVPTKRFNRPAQIYRGCAMPVSPRLRCRAFG